MIPKRRTRPRMMAPKEDAPISCPGHCKWVRLTFECAALGRVVIGPLGTYAGNHECQGKMEAHHVKTRGAGGGDEQVIPFCSLAHKNHHDGCTFVGLDQATMGADLWKQSPHRLTYERKMQERTPSSARETHPGEGSTGAAEDVSPSVNRRTSASPTTAPQPEEKV